MGPVYLVQHQSRCIIPAGRRPPPLAEELHPRLRRRFLFFAFVFFAFFSSTITPRAPRRRTLSAGLYVKLKAGRGGERVTTGLNTSRAPRHSGPGSPPLSV